MSTANELAPILGTVFTAGGLIVALVSIYSLVNIESVTKRTVEERVPQQIDARIRSFLAAYGDLVRAEDLLRDKDFTRLSDAEDSVEKAVNQEPGIPGLYTAMGYAYSEATANMFCRTRSMRPPLTFQYMDPRLPPGNQFPQIAAKAFLWLTRAFDRGDGDRDIVSLRLAELSGMLGDLRGTMKWLDKLPPSSLSDGLSLYTIFYLVGSCKDDHDLRRLGNLLNRNLLLSSDDIGGMVKENLKQDPPVTGMWLLTIPRTGFAYNPPAVPGVVGLNYVDTGEFGFASWQPREVSPGVMAPTMYPGGASPQDEQSQKPISELIAYLAEHFYLVARW